MNCWWHQWKISGAADSGRGLRRGTERHIARCERCRDFAAQVQRMGRMLGDDTAHLLSPQWSESEVGSFGHIVAPAKSDTPYLDAPPPDLPGGRRKFAHAQRSLQIRRISAAAAAAIIIVAGIIAYENGQSDQAVASLPYRPALGPLVTQAAQAMQSPMERQLQMMVAEVSSAAQVLVPPWPTPSQSPDATATP